MIIIGEMIPVFHPYLVLSQAPSLAGASTPAAMALAGPGAPPATPSLAQGWPCQGWVVEPSSGTNQCHPVLQYRGNILA